MDQLHQSLPADTQKITQEANSHICWNMLAEQQGRNALNFQQAGIQRAAQENEPADRGEDHVAVGRATKLSGAEMRTKKGALENQAEQTYTSHQVKLVDEMNVVAGDAVENQRKVWSVKQRQNFKGVKNKVNNICKHLSRVFDAT